MGWKRWWRASPMKRIPGPSVTGWRAPAAAWARVEKVLVWPGHWACSTRAMGRVGAAPCSSRARARDWIVRVPM